MTATDSSLRRLGEHAIQIMGNGSRADFDEIVHPQAVNRESDREPPDCRGLGPDAFWATATWLRTAFADLRYDVHEVVEQDGLVVVHNTMSGRHVGDMIVYGPEGRPAQVFPPTGRTFASTQSHWLRFVDRRVIEHWANRDDVGTGHQLGWTPPSPAYLVRMTLATRRARRAAR